MELTGIGNENAAAFQKLLPELSLSDYTVAIGAIEDGHAAGVALYNVLADALILDYIFVAEEYRRRGIGEALVLDFLEEIQDSGAAALHVNYPEKEKDLHAFFLALDFLLFRDGTAYRLRVERLLQSKPLAKLLKVPGTHTVIPVSRLKEVDRQVLKTAMIGQNLDETALDDRSLTPALSLASMDEKGMPAACILVQKVKHEIAVIYLVNFSPNPMQLVDLLRAFKAAIMDIAQIDDEFVFVTMDDRMKLFVEKLLDNKEDLIEEGNVISGIMMI
jgi:GNAT superfamily N-acetyltransferase